MKTITIHTPEPNSIPVLIVIDYIQTIQDQGDYCIVSMCGGGVFYKTKETFREIMTEINVMLINK